MIEREFHDAQRSGSRAGVAGRVELVAGRLKRQEVQGHATPRFVLELAAHANLAQEPNRALWLDSTAPNDGHEAAERTRGLATRPHRPKYTNRKCFPSEDDAKRLVVLCPSWQEQYPLLILHQAARTPSCTRNKQIVVIVRFS